MAYLTDILTNTTVGEEFPLFHGEAGLQGVYGKVLSKFKDFVCGSAKQVTAELACGGRLVGLEVGSSPATDDWVLEFSDDVNFVVSGVITLETYPGVLTGAAPNRSVTISNLRFTFTCYEGATPFGNGDIIEFHTEPSPLHLVSQAWEVVGDTAKGSGSKLAYAEMFSSPTLSGDTNFKGTLTNLSFEKMKQDDIRPMYVAFYSSGTVAKLLDYAGVQIGTDISVPNTLGAYVNFTATSAGKAVGLRITRGTYPFDDTTFSGAIPSGGNFFTINVRTSSGQDSHLSRILVMKAKGLAGTDSIYFTMAQRVGGAWQRFYIEWYLSPGYNANLPVFLQANQSKAGRIRHRNGVSCYFAAVANGRRAYIMTEPSASDPQLLGGGFFTPHASPSEYAWPAFVGGNLSDTDTVSSVDDSGTFINPLGAFFHPLSYSGASNSNLWLAAPATSVTWLQGKHAVNNGNGSQFPEFSFTQNPAAFNGVFITPWATACAYDGSEGYRLHPSVFNPGGADPVIRALSPSCIYAATATLTGALGEFDGVFFVGDSNDSEAVVNKTTVSIGGGDYLLWNPTPIPAVNAPLTCAILLE